MKILVIGNGFIGASIIHKLEQEGHELLIFSRTRKAGILSPQVIGDVFIWDDFLKTLAWEPHVIVHTAWITAHGDYPGDSSNYDYAEFTSRLARAVSKRKLKHLIVLGSCAEYGNQTNVSVAGLTELKPNNLYARQKIEALNAAKLSLLGTDVRLTWARIFQPYGPHQDKKRLIPSIIGSLNKNLKVELRDTSSILDWITTRDIASAISWIIKHDTPIEVDVGTGVGYTNTEVLQHVELLLGRTGQSAARPSVSPMKTKVSLVGKDSPLFVSGWLPSDSLHSGLEWVIRS